MAEEQPLLDAPIPGMAMTAELGSRPWQTPSQYNTVEEALDYYIPRLESEEISTSLMDVLEMGIPVTTIANTMQLSGVMEGKHTVDVGMLILPVLVELIMLMGDRAGIKYTSGLEKGKEMRGSLIELAVSKFNEAGDTEEPTEEEGSMSDILDMPEEDVSEKTGIMSRVM
tara:strand:+ start:887 stop:1396 length:510 start_codon:yes stop_codon:yes gene_type:complete